MNRPSESTNRSVSVGGDATGNVIQTGDNNTASLDFTRATFPPPESVDIKLELAAIRELLVHLQSEDSNKIGRAIDDAQEELARADASRDEVGSAVDRALKYAKKAEGFAETATRLKSHVINVAAWLGDNWHRLLSLLGSST